MLRQHRQIQLAVVEGTVCGRLGTQCMVGRGHNVWADAVLRSAMLQQVSKPYQGVQSRARCTCLPCSQPQQVR